MTIGVFDTGRGGEFVAKKLRARFPEHQFDVINDMEHAPYGEKSEPEIITLTEAALQPLLKSCTIIVIACNTATASAIEHLRERYPSHFFIGFEPMIKPASILTKSRHITLLATHATASSKRTQELIAKYAEGLTIDIPETYGWARAIDNNAADSIDLTKVQKSVATGSDTIILGCTHYTALEDRLRDLTPSAAIIEPTPAVAEQIQRVIAIAQQQ